MIKVMIVGCGAVLQQLYRKPLQDLESSGFISIVGVVDPARNRLNSAMHWFNDAVGFTEVNDAMTALKNVDLTIIASPPSLHAEQAISVMESGSHVLCEKPMADSVAAAQRMHHVARQCGRVLAIGMLRRFYPAVAKLKELVKDGAFGDQLQIIYRDGSALNWPLVSVAQFSRSTGGGGVLIDRGIHALDTLFFLFGRAAVVRSADDAIGSDSVEANMSLELKTDYGPMTVQLSWEHALNNGFFIYGNRAQGWLDINSLKTIWLRKEDNSSWKRVIATASWPIDLHRAGALRHPSTLWDCIKLQLVSVLRAITLGEAPMVGGADGIAVLSLIEAAYNNAVPLEKTWLPMAEQQADALDHWRVAAASQSTPGIVERSTFASTAHV